MPALAPVATAPSDRFQYNPPAAAQSACRILVKPNLGYPVGPPATVSMAVLGEVVRSLRQHNPKAEILIVEGVCSKVAFGTIMAKLGVHQLLSDRVHLLNADELEPWEYPNRSPSPVRFQALWAPKLLQEVDCCLSVSAFKRTQLRRPNGRK